MNLRISLSFICVFLVILSLNIAYCNAQRNYVNLQENWKTNKSKSLISLKELTLYQPKDAIQPLYQPSFWSIEESESYYLPHEPILVVSYKDVVKGYPLSVLLYHLVVNDRIAGIPILVSYDPLCDVAKVYDRRVRQNNVTYTLEIGNAGMIRKGNMMLWDRETETWWQHLTGEALVGDFSGLQLKTISHQILPFQQFQDSYEYDLILSKNINAEIPYGVTPYYQYDDINKGKPFLLRYVPQMNLPLRTRVLHLNIKSEYKVYTFEKLAQQEVINDVVAGNYLTIFYTPKVKSVLDQTKIEDAANCGAATAFSSFVEGKRLIFRKEGNYFTDSPTNSKWDITGLCVEGKLKGKQLELISAYQSFAFASFIFYADVRTF